MARRLLVVGGLVVCVGAWGQAADRATTLSRVHAAGVLNCGVDREEPEYSTMDDHGSLAAFDADLCRAVAVAVLGDRARVTVVEYPDDQASMAALNAGQVDMVPTLSDDFTHSVGTHLALTRPVLWDGVGFLVLGSSPAMQAQQLEGKKVCFIAETAVEEGVRAWFAREHLDFAAFPFQEEGEMEAAFATGNCGALAGDRTRLAGTQRMLAQHGRATRLLPETVSSDPLAAAVRDGDTQWASIVQWVMDAVVQAEESGVTQANAQATSDALAKAKGGDPALWFLLGGSREIGSRLGLENDWVVRVIEATGNYGEIYARDLGEASAVKLPRGKNRLVRDGGLMTTLPLK